MALACSQKKGAFDTSRRGGSKVRPRAGHACRDEAKKHDYRPSGSTENLISI